MFNLVKNELYKLFKTKKIYVFLFIIFVYNFLPSLEKVMGTIGDEILINGQTTPFYMLNFMITNIFPIFIIVALADMVTGEYASGTLKLPLLHPVSRVNLLAAKAIALTIVLLFILMFSLILSYIMGTAIFGWGDQFIYQEPDQALQYATFYSTKEGIAITFISYVISAIPLIAFGLVIMFLALIINSSGVLAGLSIGLVIFLSIFGEVVVAIRPFLIIDALSMFKTLFITKNMSYFIVNMIVTALYGIVFFLGSIYLFKNKDLLH
ncbi:MAG: ABC transporter permease [Bacillota bacterium]|nr:ABC transporter permease [Bacillota bacterium]